MTTWTYTDSTNLVVTDGANTSCLASVLPEGTPVAPYAPPPVTAADQATAMLTSGLIITSASAPAVNGVYAADPTSWAKVLALVAGIDTNGTFPQGAASYPYPQASGTFVTFPSVTVFKAFATALEAFVAQLDLYAAGAPGAVLPTSTATIP